MRNKLTAKELINSQVQETVFQLDEHSPIPIVKYQEKPPKMLYKTHVAYLRNTEFEHLYKGVYASGTAFIRMGQLVALCYDPMPLLPPPYCQVENVLLYDFKAFFCGFERDVHIERQYKIDSLLFNEQNNI
jgi:hypothetical protein